MPRGATGGSSGARTSGRVAPREETGASRPLPPSGPEGHAGRREAVMVARSCGRRALGQSALLTLSILPLAGGCSPQASAPPEAARPVKTVVVTPGGESHVRTFPGKVEASKKVELAFQVPGLIVQLPI